MALVSKELKLKLDGTIPMLVPGVSGNYEAWLFALVNIILKNGEGNKYGMAYYFMNTPQFIAIYNRMYPLGPFLPAEFAVVPHPTALLNHVEQDLPPLVQGANAAAREAQEKAETRNKEQWERKQNDRLMKARIMEAFKDSLPDAIYKQILGNALQMYELDSMVILEKVLAFGLLEQGGRLTAINADIAKPIGSRELASVFIRNLIDFFRSRDSITGRPTDSFVIRDRIFEALALRLTASTGSMFASYNVLVESLAANNERFSDYTLDRFIVWVNNWEKVHFETATADSLSLSAVKTDPSSDLVRKISTLEAEVSELKRTSPAQGAGSQAGIAGAPGSGKKAKARAAAAAAAAVLAGGGGAAAIGGGAKQQQVACSFCKYTNHPAAKCRFNPANASMTLEEFNVFAKRT